MSKTEKLNEEMVFKQEVSDDELEAVTGGDCGAAAKSSKKQPDWDSVNNCVRNHFRDIYGGKGFPNCAATVEDGSWCSDNDACHGDAVVYVDTNDCIKVWR